MNFAHRLAILTVCLLFFSAVGFAADPAAGSAPATQPNGGAVVKKINLDEFEKMRSEKDAVVLDVRTPKEFAAGHVPGAINIDWHSRDFSEQVQKLDKSKTYLVHCAHGGRSAAATKRMATMDFCSLYDFTGGFSTYEKEGKPVEK